ncbi:MAG: DUF2231 domain-containing protein [Tildeniella nuda ZEHNDER 1965/U140]|jgi:uncharacterized membrane protein|nr:DUF2231 domain-containing protein [Tildeniella nuda ZEHNDER 1965/U140]
MTQTPNIPPVIESDEREYRDSGVPSTVAIAGHPFHPLIVTFPIAFLTGALGTDVGYWLTGDAFWARASFWLIGAGLVAGLAAAITGMLDFVKIDRVREHQAGWIHMVGNIAVLSLSLISFVLRWGNQTGAILPIGLVLSLFVATLIGITGWYGAELVYRHKIAVIGYGSNHRP